MENKLKSVTVVSATYVSVETETWCSCVSQVDFIPLATVLSGNAVLIQDVDIPKLRRPMPKINRASLPDGWEDDVKRHRDLIKEVAAMKVLKHHDNGHEVEILALSGRTYKTVRYRKDIEQYQCRDAWVITPQLISRYSDTEYAAVRRRTGQTFPERRSDLPVLIHEDVLFVDAVVVKGKYVVTPDKGNDEAKIVDHTIDLKDWLE